MAVLYASISVLNLMRAATGSQCREIKRGVTWALLGYFQITCISESKFTFFFEGKNCLARCSSVKHCKMHDSASFFLSLCHLMSYDPTLQLSH